MADGFYKTVVKEIKRLGFWYDRPAKGSHEIWTNGDMSLLVARNMKSRHTANNVLKDAGSDKKL